MIPIGTNLQRQKLPKATLGLILANCIVFAMELALPADQLKWTFQNLGFSPVTSNPAAPITSLFLHGDIYHIAFNMLFLWIFGSPAEERVGTRNFLKYYFGAGLAAGYLSAAMETIARPGSTIACIGASGAISGIMALFLYRCFYAKMKLVITPFFLPRQVNVPVMPLVLFWFLQDVFLGILSISHASGVAHWAHVGGFAFGIVIGRLNRYGHEGRVEQLRGRVLKKLSEGGGWKAAEKDLLKLVERLPNDAEVNHDLARLYAGKGETGPAEQYYAAAVQRYFTSEPLSAAYAVIEYETALAKPMQTQYLLKAADALIREYQYDDARKVLAPLTTLADPSGTLVERGLHLFARLCLHLSEEDQAENAIKLLAERFPQSRYPQELRALQVKRDGALFPPAPASAAPVAVGREDAGEESQEEKEAERLGKIDTFERFFADPVFWIIMLALNILGPIFFRGLYLNRLSPLYLVASAFVMTILYRTVSISDLFQNRPSEERARREVESTRWYDDAVMAEKGERYHDAATLYEKLVAREKGNIQARFNLARVYHRRLNDAAKALSHYRALTEHAPKDHPFHFEAQNAIQELRNAARASQTSV
jgi:membrane associated rhomboid family serine protease